MRFFWFVTLLASIASGLVLAGGWIFAKGAPQEAAVAALALCIVAIPYVFTRAIEGFATTSWRRQVLEELRKRATDQPS